MSDVPALLSVKEFCRKHPSFPEATIRDWLFKSRNPDIHRGWPVKGFDKCVIRAGRRILLDELQFFTWLKSRQPGAKHG